MFGDVEKAPADPITHSALYAGEEIEMKEEQC